MNTVPELAKPGAPVEPGIVRQTYFPCFGIVGGAKFRIAAGRARKP